LFNKQNYSLCGGKSAYYSTQAPEPVQPLALSIGETVSDVVNGEEYLLFKTNMGKLFLCGSTTLFGPGKDTAPTLFTFAGSGSATVSKVFPTSYAVCTLFLMLIFNC